MDDFFKFLESIASVGALVVSIIVFVVTIKKSEKENYMNLTKENFLSFLQKIDELFREIDPQKFYDNYSIIYGRSEFLYADKFAEIKRMNSKIHYLSQEILLYTPEKGEIIEIIIKLLNFLEKESIQINEIFCYDIELRNSGNSNEIDLKYIDSTQKKYENDYNNIVEFVFKGLHLVQESIFNREKELENYKLEYEEKYRNAI